MATYNQLKERIGELKSRTGRSSISPDDTFGLVEELLDKLEGVDMNAASMSIRKTYSSVASMDADTNPVDAETGKALKAGQLVAVNNEEDDTENAIYRYLNPGWEKVDRLGDLTGYAKTGGSEKTVKDVEDEIVQLAGGVIYAYTSSSRDNGGIYIDEEENQIRLQGINVILGGQSAVIPDSTVQGIPADKNGVMSTARTSVIAVNTETLEVRHLSVTTGYSVMDQKVWRPIAVLRRNSNSTSSVGRFTSISTTAPVYGNISAIPHNTGPVIAANGHGRNTIEIRRNKIFFNRHGFSLLYNGRRYVITGGGNNALAEDKIISPIDGVVRTYVYLNLNKLTPFDPLNPINNYWHTDPDIFVVTSSESSVFNKLLICTFYQNIIYPSNIISGAVAYRYNNIDNYMFRRAYVARAAENVFVEVNLNTKKIFFPRSFLLFDPSTAQSIFMNSAGLWGDGQEVDLIPTNWSGTPATTSNGVLMFNPETRQIRNIRYDIFNSPLDNEVWWPFANIRSDDNSAYIAGDFQWKIVGQAETGGVVARNIDSESAVDAAIDRRYSNATGGIIKRFAFLHSSDTHGDTVRHDHVVEYFNYKKYLDALVVTGDMHANNFRDSVDWFVNTINKVNRDILPVIGNHDVGNSQQVANCGSHQQVYERLIQPFEQYGIITNGKNYWYKDYDQYNIRIIAIYEYDNEDINPNNTDWYLTFRGNKIFSQDQINWFVNTLNNTPADYHVIVLTHLSPFGDYSEIEYIDEWTDSDKKTSGIVSQSYVIGNPIGDIIDAWCNGTSINRSYSFDGWASYLTPIVANFNFSGRGTGIFVGYFHGHYHRDAIVRLKNYPNQHAVRIACTSADSVRVRREDLNRTQGTKSEDAFNIVSVDTSDRTVYIVRVGANTTKFLEDRKMIKYTY